MDWIALRDLLGFLTRFAVAGFFVSLWLTTRRVTRNDGILFGRLAAVWLCLAILYSLRSLGDLESAVDFLPDFNLLQYMYNWLWLPTGVVACALARFLSAMKQELPRKP